MQPRAAIAMLPAVMALHAVLAGVAAAHAMPAAVAVAGGRDKRDGGGDGQRGDRSGYDLLHRLLPLLEMQIEREGGAGPFPDPC